MSGSKHFVFFPLVFSIVINWVCFTNLIAGSVEVKNNQLYVDGVAQPQLYGAELQYFRLRGGTGRNLPRDQVIAFWNQALDRMVEAKMNAISFYIPWDFHEYAPGKFDFTGTVDEDGDGKPDYPSRDLVTFFRLIKEHGIEHIMVRPGPYINAEWGFLGFGAVPKWFHDEFPQSHMQNAAGQKTKLYDYTNPEFRFYAKRWLQELYKRVLVHYIGPGQPIDFIQLDNETNYQWQSLYNLDYSKRALGLYRNFLRQHYGTLSQLNKAHHKSWKHWDDIKAPVTSGINGAEDQDWYRFHDVTIHDYLHFVRQVWEDLGVKEPSVLFTLAESYNANKDGLLPHYIYRNDPGVTGLMTVNLYPKTWESEAHPLLNQPFKADHDVKATHAANALYWGFKQDWALGPEIQGGWWRGIPVSQEARQQTYLSTIGHGLKALFIYYFNEGDNFGYQWATDKIKPLFDRLKQQAPYADIPDEQLPQEFWNKLQAQSDAQILVGFDVKAAILGDLELASTLYFDAPLDAKARPKISYDLVKHIGETLIHDHGDFLGRAIEMTDPVCLVKDSNQHVPSRILDVDSLLLNADWAGGLLGLVMQSGINPKIIHWGISSRAEMSSCRVLITQDNGLLSHKMADYFKTLMNHGATVLNVLGDQLAEDMGYSVAKLDVQGMQKAYLSSNAMKNQFTLSKRPFAVYDLNSSSQARPFLQDANGQAIGYSVKQGKGQFIQLAALFYDGFNSDSYGELTDVVLRREVMDAVLDSAGVKPRLSIVEGGDRIVAFGRQAPEGNDFLITVKSANHHQPVDFHVALKDVDPKATYRVTRILEGSTVTMKGDELMHSGFLVCLPANGSAVYRIREAI